MWVKQFQIEAASEEEAIEKLKAMSLSDILNDESFFASQEVDISDIDTDALDFNLEVEVTDVIYDFNNADLKPEVAEYLNGILPKSFKFNLSGVTDEDDAELMIEEEIFGQTGYDVESFSFKVIKKV
jgi:hypothetical protein